MATDFFAGFEGNFIFIATTEWLILIQYGDYRLRREHHGQLLACQTNDNVTSKTAFCQKAAKIIFRRFVIYEVN